MSTLFLGCVIGFVAWFLVCYLAAGFYTVNQNERAVKNQFRRYCSIASNDFLIARLMASTSMLPSSR